MNEFDTATDRFARRVRRAADWKNTYFGAAYSTRIKEAIHELRTAIQDMEKFLDSSNAP